MREKGPRLCRALACTAQMCLPGGSASKEPPAVQKTRARSLGQEDPLEEEMATHSSVLAWRIPWTDEPGGLQSMGPQRLGHDGNVVSQGRKNK